MATEEGLHWHRCHSLPLERLHIGETPASVVTTFSQLHVRHGLLFRDLSRLVVPGESKTSTTRFLGSRYPLGIFARDPGFLHSYIHTTERLPRIHGSDPRWLEKLASSRTRQGAFRRRHVPGDFWHCVRWRSRLCLSQAIDDGRPLTADSVETKGHGEGVVPGGKLSGRGEKSAPQGIPELPHPFSTEDHSRLVLRDMGIAERRLFNCGGSIDLSGDFFGHFFVTCFRIA